jgi:gas vesicle protein
MAWCLVKEKADQFKQAITDGKIKPAELSNMTSEKRHKFFAEMLGEENAKNTNALFESKLLLKNKEQGWVTWAKKLTGITQDAKRDLQSKISRMVEDVRTGKTILNPETEDLFLKDLASTKLGTNITFDEAKQITNLSTKTTDTKKGMNLEDFTFKNDAERLKHGDAIVGLKNYVEQLKDSSKLVTWKDRANPLSRDFAVYQLPGISKAVKASFDASALLRQGLKTLLTHPTVWAENSAKTFKDIGRQIKAGAKSDQVMNAIKADIYSRPNALNGLYDKFGIAVGMLEEQFPTMAPAKVPVLGNLFKASEVAYTGFLYRTRADLADMYIKMAMEQGVNVADKAQAKSIGKLINSLTGRGSLGSGEKIGQTLNATMFSPKFLASNLETLTGHYFGAGLKSNFARKEAAKNWLKIFGGIGVTLAIADRMFPGSVDWDSRSSNFGKIKIGDTRFDVSGGMSSIVTLVSRIATQSSKSGQTGRVSKLGSGYGQTKGMDIFYQFGENKLAPTASLIKDLINQSDYQGNKLTLGKEIKDTFAPLPATNVQEIMSNPNSAPLLLAMAADALGIATNTYSISGDKDWTSNTGVELQQMQTKLGPAKFKKANDDYNTSVNAKIQKVVTDPRYKKLSDDDKQKKLDNVKDKVKNDIFLKYKFVYKKEPDTVGKSKDSAYIKNPNE